MTTIDTSATEAITDVEPEDNGPSEKAERAGAATSTYWHFADVTTRGRFRTTVDLGNKVNSVSQVVVSICQLTDQNVPFLGDAAMQVFNVVPQGDGKVIVVGHIYWDTNLKARLNYVIVN